MAPRLSRLREPAAVVLLVVLVLRLPLGLVTFSPAAFVLDLVTALLLAAVVASCVLWQPTAHARPLSIATLVVLTLTAVLTLVAAVVWLSDVRATMTALAVLTEFGRLVLGLPLVVLATVALWRLRSAAVSADSRPAPTTNAVAGADRADAAPALAEQPASRPADEPTWQPDEAAGAAWLSAGDAATGAAASGWGTSAEQGGWVPQTGAAPSDPAQPGSSPVRWD